MEIVAPKVSVLLSYYKGIDYLEAYLQNVSEQTFVENIELVFVGCLLTDQEQKLIELYRKKINITLISLEVLKTQSECWNIGIKNSKADYCCIWNVDDLRTKQSIQKQYETICSNNNIGAVYGMFVISNRFGDRFGKLIDHTNYHINHYEEYERSMLLGPFFMFRKALCDNIGYFDEQFKCCADYDFAIKLAKASKIEIIHGHIDGYFLDANKGLSTRGDGIQPIERTIIELRYGLLDKVEDQWKQTPLFKNYKI